MLVKVSKSLVSKNCHGLIVHSFQAKMVNLGEFCVGKE